MIDFIIYRSTYDPSHLQLIANILSEDKDMFIDTGIICAEDNLLMRVLDRKLLMETQQWLWVSTWGCCFSSRWLNYNTDLS